MTEKDMGERVYCLTSDEMCTPKNCPVELCEWRDTEWILQAMRELEHLENLEYARLLLKRRKNTDK